MDSNGPVVVGPVTWREVVVCVVALAVGVSILPAVGGTVLWTHPLWLDELCCTFYPIEQATSPIGVIANIGRSQDFAPPLLHLIVWTVARVAGGFSPALLRSVALVSVCLAIVFVYAALRRRFPVAPSAAGALAIAAHPLVITHAFEGRFYGPWLMFAAGYAWAAGQRGRTAAIYQALFAVGVVTIHWFGIISLAIMATAVAVSFAPRWRDGLRAVTPSVAGVVALAACTPFLLRQGAGSSAFSWIPPLSGAQLMGIARVFFLAIVPVFAATIVFVQFAIDARSGLRAALTPLRRELEQPSVAALASLGLFPVALVVLSILAQPLLLDRYAITTVLFWGPLVALAMERLPRATRGVALAALLVLFGPNVRTSIADRQMFALRVATDSADFARAKTLGIPVVFPWFHTLYPVLGPHRRDPTPARYLDVPDSALLVLYPGDRMAWLRNRIRVEGLSARSHAVVYGFPAVVSSADLDSVARFAVMTFDLRIRGGAKQAENWGRVVFPRHTLVSSHDNVSIFERTK